MFILAATDDRLKLASHSVDLYRDWIAAKKPAELHMFATGGHGFGMRKQNLPADRWIERFADWMDMQGAVEEVSRRPPGSALFPGSNTSSCQTSPKSFTKMS